MNSHSAEVSLLTLPLVLLAAAVISVPIARFGRLSAIVAYLVAGVVIGPYGLGMFARPETIVTVAELGVVMLLFLIGLELELSRLLAMRRDIFGLGVAQLVLTAGAIAGLAIATGMFNWRAALVAGLALALSATAIALRILEERGHLQQPYGQRAFAILLFQDMAVVPLLALIPLLAPRGAVTEQVTLAETASSVGLAGLAIAALVVAGRYLLNPFFRLLAWTDAREIMTAAALLVVLGSALLMQAVGMSMALGAFLAGVLLAESSYRHELEADIEPFRGLLLALFFMGVGMTIDMRIVMANLWLVVAAAIVITLLKAGIVWALFRVTCARRGEALQAGSVLTGAGEFAFVLLPLGTSLGILSATQGSLLSAIAAVTLLIGPPFAEVTERLLRRFARTQEPEAEDFGGTTPSVLVIGFGRFGQIVSQYLLAEGVDVTAIDLDSDMIPIAARFGFKVYYGDGTRLDVLRAAGLEKARLIAICVDKPGRLQPHRRTHARRISRHQDFRALVRPRPHAAASGEERRLRSARDVRVRQQVRPQDAGGDRHRTRARRAGGGFHPHARPRPHRDPAGGGHLRRHRPVAPAPANGAVQRAVARRATAQRRGGGDHQGGEGGGVRTGVPCNI